MLNKILKKSVSHQDETTKLYKSLSTEEYKTHPFDTEDLGEGMSVVNEVIDQYWKPRFLLDHRLQRAYEFMNKDEKLVTVTQSDVDWDSMAELSEDDIKWAKEQNFHYPSFILKYKNDVAQVRWQLNPDGMYYMDEDGFGITDDQEVNIYGFIDRAGKVLVKFRNIKNDDELIAMRAEAEQKVKQEHGA